MRCAADADARDSQLRRGWYWGTQAFAEKVRQVAGKLLHTAKSRGYSTAAVRGAYGEAEAERLSVENEYKNQWTADASIRYRGSNCMVRFGALDVDERTREPNIHNIQHFTHFITMRIKNIWILIKAASASWVDDYAQSMGAALAYYTLFSIAPLLLMVISIAGLFFGVEAARGEIVEQLRGLMGQQGAEALQSLLIAANKPLKGATATIIGSIFLLIGATTVFGELQSALDRIWRAPQRNKSGLWHLLRERLLSFGMIMCICFLLMVSLVASAALAALGKWWGPYFSEWQFMASLLNFVVSFGFATTLFAMIYKIMPRAKVDWSDVWIGAVVTALLFTIGKSLIGIYIGKSSVTSVFGAAGSLVVVLVWVYYSAQIFLMGAEFTWAYASTFGSHKKQALPDAAPEIPSQSVAKQPEQNLQEAKEAAVAEEVRVPDA